jgi:hypothetical protein
VAARIVVIALVLKVCGDLALDEADRNKSADIVDLLNVVIQ